MSSAVDPVAGLGDNTIVIEEGIFLAKFLEPIRHWLEDDRVSEAVSYTHLTLPTIYSV